jgi:hypothetical protein
MVLTPTDQIQPDGVIHVVGISHNLELSPEEEQVRLPYARNGKQFSTKLEGRSAVICRWVIKVDANECDIGQGNVPQAQVQEVIRKVRELNCLPPGMT